MTFVTRNSPEITLCVPYSSPLRRRHPSLGHFRLNGGAPTPIFPAVTSPCTAGAISPTLHIAPAMLFNMYRVNPSPRDTAPLPLAPPSAFRNARMRRPSSPQPPTCPPWWAWTTMRMRANQGDVLAVHSFGSSASVAGSGLAGCGKDPANTLGGTHSGVGPGPDGRAGFGGDGNGSNEVPKVGQ
jgi:hypothetical protein